MSKSADANLVFVKSTILHRSVILKNQENRIELVTRPAGYQRALEAGITEDALIDQKIDLQGQYVFIYYAKI